MSVVTTLARHVLSMGTAVGGEEDIEVRAFQASPRPI
jgi:hypothetical protein